MTTLDVRNTPTVEVINEIRFGNKNSNYYIADILSPASTRNVSGLEIRDSESTRYLCIKDIEHADNLIKALEQAKLLGWLK